MCGNAVVLYKFNCFTEWFMTLLCFLHNLAMDVPDVILFITYVPAFIWIHTPRLQQLCVSATITSYSAFLRLLCLFSDYRAVIMVFGTFDRSNLCTVFNFHREELESHTIEACRTRGTSKRSGAALLQNT